MDIESNLDFKIGDLVHVKPIYRLNKTNSEGGYGCVVDLCDESTTVSVRYVVTNSIEEGVDITRLLKTPLNTITGVFRTRSTDINQPGSYTPATPTVETTTTTPTETNEYTTLQSILLQSYKWNYKTNTTHPLVDYLQQGLSKDPGWLKDVTRDTTNKNSQLTTEDKLVVIVMTTLLSGQPHQTISNPNHLITHAWGLRKNTPNRLFNDFVQNKGNISRKIRSDQGSNIFTSHKKRKSHFTAFNLFKKNRHNQPRDCYTPLNRTDLQEEWILLGEEEKEKYGRVAESYLKKGDQLHNDVIHSLQSTKGICTWRELKGLIGGDVAQAETIRKHVTNQKSFRYVQNRIYPALDKQAMDRRVTWAQAFWVFWKSAVTMRKTKVLLVHMDEKWFYSVVLRNNNKEIREQDVEVLPVKIHHKQHRHKVMCVCVSAFLPSKNNIELGGKAFKVSLERCGKMVKAKKDSFKRQYFTTRYGHIKYNYPKEEENKLRSKGSFYFLDMEVTGSEKGDDSEHKFDLLTHHRACIFPRLQEIIKQEEENKRGLVIKVKYQIDGAGCHTDKKFQSYLEGYMGRNGWIFAFQPSQSPITNVHDSCIFPSLSKRVTKEQGVLKGSKQLDGEELWKVVKYTWEKLPTQVISRAFIGHHQIVCSILHHNGDNTYLHEKDGLHFGVTKCYKDQEESVILMTNPPINPKTVRPGLKYTPPDVSELSVKTLLSYQQLQFLKKHMGPTARGSDVEKIWKSYSQDAKK